MSDLEITNGGMIAVSVPLLRDQAGVLGGIAERLAAVEVALGVAGAVLALNPAAGAEVASAYTAQAHAAQRCERTAQLQHALTQAADIYEVIEHEVAARVYEGIDDSRYSYYALSVGQFAQSNPEAYERARQLLDGERADDPLSTAGQALFGGGLPVPLIAGAPGVASDQYARAGRENRGQFGRVRPDQHSPVKSDATVHATPTVTGDAPREPLTLAGMLDLFPDHGDVAVTTYEFADGSREHIVAVGGTENWNPLGSDDVLDLASNLQLYRGRESELRAAVREAMAAAGVQRGASVTMMGFSQGSMAALAEASDNEYEIRELITMGEPQDVWLPAHVPHMSIAHTGWDPVVALAAGGWGVSGAGRSDVTIRRAGGHSTQAYRETAKQADDSGDPRIAEAHARWRRYGNATSATRVEFELTRTK